MARNSLIREFFDYLKENKKWWLLPIIIVFALLGGVLYLAHLSPAAAPFIYTLF